MEKGWRCRSAAGVSGLDLLDALTQTLKQCPPEFQVGVEPTLKRAEHLQELVLARIEQAQAEDRRRSWFDE